ncbi:MAG: phospholipase D-like domain-containing protein [Acidimicrobiales bacterium]
MDTPRYRIAMESLIGVPATDGNRVAVLRNGDQAFPAMLGAVGSAESTIDLHTFGHWNGTIGGELAEALCGRAAAGVRVRVLLDALGTRHIDRALVDRLARAGANVQWFRPLTNWRITQSTHRGHRKLLICDSRLAFTGGVGIGDHWLGDARDASQWRDTNVGVEGPAVNGLRGAFINNWAETRQPLYDAEVDPFPDQPPAGESAVQVVRGDAETGWGDMSTLVRSFVGLARERLRISASYFVPDDAGLALLCGAARRGVRVELLRPGPHVSSRVSSLASDSLCRRLLDGGVKIWSYQPTLLQAKVMTVDGAMASVGAVNFNSRSLTLDDEVNVVLFDPELVAGLDAHFDDDVAHAEPLTADQWGRRGLRRRSAEVVPGVLARRL